MKKLICLCLVLCVLLSGCSFVDFRGYFENLAWILDGNSITAFEDMVYTRPDMTQFQQVLDASVKTAETETNLDNVVESIYAFYGEYDGFYTAYALSNIHYSLDLTDTYWETEYNYCSQLTGQADAGLDSLYRALAKSPIRQQLEAEEYFGADFFDAYEGETLYDETFQKMLEEEALLQSQYYSLTSLASGSEYYSDNFFRLYGSQMADVFVKLVKLRQDIAAYAGYSSYQKFANEFYYGRDYTVQQTSAYLEQIRQKLVPLYRDLEASGYWYNAYVPTNTDKAYTYVQTAAKAMGGMVQEAFEVMEAGKLYDISYSPNKFNNSFAIYLTNYYVPYIFLSPTGTNYDQLAFAHEFGHFCNEYASGGSMAGLDVAEVFSQGMEYLSLCYAPDEALRKLKMADSLQVFVGQAAYASFEQQVYDLKGDDLTTENVQSLYEQVMTAYGMDYEGWDSRDYVLVPHFFVSSMYVVSYVVSNDVALQLYMLEQSQPGQGLSRLADSLTTQQAGIQAFVQEAELTSPFTQGHVEEIAKTLQEILE